MKKESTFQILKKVIVGLVLASLLTCAVYIVSTPLLGAIFYHDQVGKRDFTPLYYTIFFIFQFAFWLCYTRKTSDEFKVIRKDSFSWKEDFRETMRGEGKILVILLAVLAAISELSLILYAKYAEIPAQNPIGAALCFMFSFQQVTGLVDIVLLRSVVAYLATTPLLILQIVWQHSRDFKKWQEPGKH